MVFLFEGFISVEETRIPPVHATQSARKRRREVVLIVPV
jgi:hypothetical protein